MGMVRISLIAVLGAISVAACSSSDGKSVATTQTPSASASVTAAPTESASPTSTPAPTGSTTTPPTAAPTAAGVQPCSNKDLVVKSDTTGGAAGTSVVKFIVTNKGPKACTLDGHPAVHPYAGSAFKRISGFKIGQVPQDFGDLGGTPAATTLAASSGTAAFFVVYGTAPVGKAKCVKVTGILFSAPSRTNWADAPAAPFPFTSCGGDVQVSSIFPASQTL
jgi:hypothetical protein